MTMYLFNREKDAPPSAPVSLLCTGVTAAGCTTSLFSIAETGLAEFAPPQFTTRKLRPNERSGEQFYSVSQEKLAKVQAKIAIQGEYCGNAYGMFQANVRKIREILKKKSVVIDAIHSPTQWQNVLGEGNYIRSAFFAPKSPDISIDRIAIRAQQTREVLAPDFIGKRKAADTEHIRKIWAYDYWVDTTRFLTIVPALQALLMGESEEGLSKAAAYRIAVHQQKIHELLNAYSSK